MAAADGFYNALVEATMLGAFPIGGRFLNAAHVICLRSALQRAGSTSTRVQRLCHLHTLP